MQSGLESSLQSYDALPSRLRSARDWNWFGIKGNWALLFGGVSLVLTLLANPDGIAGANHRRTLARRAARAARPAGPLLPIAEESR